MPACGISVGYFAADLERLRLSTDLKFATQAEAHTRDLASSTHVRTPSGDTGMPRLIEAAGHLFTTVTKGPRADRYEEVAQTLTQRKQPMQVASLTGIGGDVTGSLPRESETLPREGLKGEEISRDAKADRVLPPVNKTAGMSPPPLDARPSSALFLASLISPQAFSFPDADTYSDKPETKKLPRGLAFQGESEDEYQGRQRRCLATAIYFEARGEPIRGQLAVAQVVMNRVRSSLYPDTICGVVFQGQLRRTGCQFSFACDGHADIPKDKERWLLANKLAKQTTDGEVWLEDVGHATHYHANYVKPAWRRQLDHVKQVGRHIFYQVREEQIEDPLNPSGSLGKGLALAKSE